MTTLRVLIVVCAAAMAALAAGCDNTPPSLQQMPEVNDENCKVENIRKIEDKGMQQEFGGKCARRGTFKPSEPRKW